MAQNLIKKGWNVSCSYDYTKSAEGGTENNIPYDIEFLDGEFTHLAIVNNPRYERANIVFNSKTEIVNDKWITVHPNGEENKGRHLLLKDGETPKEAIERTYGKGEKSDTKDSKRKDIEHNGAKISIIPDGKYSDIKIDAPEGKTFGNGDTWYRTQALTEKAEEHAKKIIDGEFGQSDKEETKDLYSDENFKENAKRLNEQFGEKPYSEWQKDVQTMLKKYGKTEEDWDNAIGARKDAFKQFDSKGDLNIDELVNVTEDYYNRISEDELKKEFKDIQKEFAKWKDKKNFSEYKDYRNKLIKIKDIYEKRFGDNKADNSIISEIVNNAIVKAITDKILNK